MPDFLLVLVALIASAASMAYWITFDSYGKHVVTQVLNRVFVTLAVAALWAWFIVACNRPWTFTAKEFYDIEMIKQPDGTAIQSALLPNFERFNVTERFCVIYPAGAQLVRKERNRTYLGIWFVANKTKTNDYAFDVIVPEKK